MPRIKGISPTWWTPTALRAAFGLGQESALILTRRNLASISDSSSLDVTWWTYPSMAEEKSYRSFLVKEAGKNPLRLTTVGQQKNAGSKFSSQKLKRNKKKRDLNQKSSEKKSRNYKLEHLGNGSPPMITQFLSYRSTSLSRVFAIIPSSVSYFSNTLPMAAM